MGKVANLLFPADFYDKKSPDGAMRTEYFAAASVSQLDVALFDFEKFEESGVISLSRPFLDSDLPLIYRGWMMKPVRYEGFYDELVSCGLKPLVEPCAYSEFHMFPCAYERHKVLRDLAPRLLAFRGLDLEAEAVNGAFGRFMLKDFVKSVKGTSFPMCIETPLSQMELDSLLDEFRHLRGDLFTEGVAFKEYVDLKRYSNATNEWRAFYLKGSLLNVCRNSNQVDTTPAPSLNMIASCEGLGSPFYTVDFAEGADGGWIVLETGDGQVSGLATAMDAVIYYQILSERMANYANQVDR